MDTTTDDRALAALDREVSRLQCECEHDAGRCPRRATYAVSAICRADGCANVASVHLACRACAESWRRQARQRGGPKVCLARL